MRFLNAKDAPTNGIRDASQARRIIDKTVFKCESGRVDAAGQASMG